MQKSFLHGGLSAPLPAWQSDQLTARIVHIGCGAFHRAHQALYCHQLLADGQGDWAICEVNLHSESGAALIANLKQQQLRYCLAEQGADGSRLRIIGAICQALHPKFDGTAGIIAALASPQTAIVSLTITEKGYCTDPASGELDLNHPLILHDLAQPQLPHSAIGYLVAALAVRRQRGLPGFSVLSCDNVRENGQVARKAVLGLAQAQDAQLAAWIAQQVSFPCTMVDRIVPAATGQTLQQIAEQLGVYDPCAIACEPFSQWVIEDQFCQGRPQWDRVGAQFVSDVSPFETMKLRMLNGSHTFLALLGSLAGYQTIADTVNDSAFRRAAHSLMMQEQAPTLRMPPGTRLDDYADSLINRFSNPALQHQTRQIATDSSQKLPQRLLDPLRWHLQTGSDCRHLLLGIAGWMRYVQGVDEQGQPYPINDPLAAQLQAICQQPHSAAQRVQALLAIPGVFGTDLPENAAFVRALTGVYQQLCANGARATVASLYQDH